MGALENIYMVSHRGPNGFVLRATRQNDLAMRQAEYISHKQDRVGVVRCLEHASLSGRDVSVI